MRSQVELQEALDSDLAARKQELTTLRFLVVGTNRAHEKSCLLRAALPLLYAHWEGFIKYAAESYVAYVGRQRIPLRKLDRGFVAIAVRGLMKQVGESGKAQVHRRVIDEILDNLDSGYAFGVGDTIDTAGNLSADVLQEIMETLGLGYDARWAARRMMIDRKLLKTRHEVAHGRLVPVDEKQFQDVHKELLLMLSEFKTQIENAAATRAFEL